MTGLGIVSRVMVLAGGRLARPQSTSLWQTAGSRQQPDSRKTGDLMNRVTVILKQFNGLQGQSTAIINESLLVLGVAIVLFASNWRLALMVIVPMPLVLFAVQRMREWIRLIFRHQWRMYDKANSTLQDILSGIRVVKAFGQESREVARFKSQAELAVTEKTKRRGALCFNHGVHIGPWAVPCPLLQPDVWYCRGTQLGQMVQLPNMRECCTARCVQ